MSAPADQSQADAGPAEMLRLLKLQGKGRAAGGSWRPKAAGGTRRKPCQCFPSSARIAALSPQTWVC